MTKLEELSVALDAARDAAKATFDDAETARYAAWDAFYAADDNNCDAAFDDYLAAINARHAARYAYQVELNKENSDD